MIELIARNLKAFLFLAVLTGFACVASGYRMPNEAIVLHNETLRFKAQEYYIAKVVDAREVKSNVALLIKPDGITTYTTDVQGGASAAISQFIRNNLPQKLSSRAIVINVEEFKAEEKMAGGVVEGKVTIALKLYHRRGDELVHLFDYRGGSRYKRPQANEIDVEPYLRTGLKNALTYINNWISKEADNNLKLATSVRVLISDYQVKAEDDTVFYAANRPLTWSDFKARPISRSRYAAEVWPSFGYDEQTDVNNGVVTVRIMMKVYLPKSECWVKDGYQTDYVLNHEQRHFDIVKIVAEQFKQKILAEKLTPSNFDGPINEDYLNSYREMSERQKKYDGETTHGTNQFVQTNWDNIITRELKQVTGKTGV